MNKTSSQDELSEARSTLTSNFGRGIMRGILCGLAGVAPRSVIQNLITLLVSLLTRVPGDSRIWARDVLFGVSHAEESRPVLTCARFSERLRTMQGGWWDEGEILDRTNAVECPPPSLEPELNDL